MKTNSMPLKRATIASGFETFVRHAAADPDIGQVIYIDFTGTDTAVKAGLASLKTQKRYLSIWDSSVKMMTRQDGEPITYTTLRKTVSTKQVNVVVIHNQAVPQKMRPNIGYAYVIDAEHLSRVEKNDSGNPLMPKNFYPMLSALLPTPMKKSWAEELWNGAWNYRTYSNPLISRIPNWNTTSLTVYKIMRVESIWKDMIRKLFDQEKIGF